MPLDSWSCGPARVPLPQSTDEWDLDSLHPEESSAFEDDLQASTLDHLPEMEAKGSLAYARAASCVSAVLCVSGVLVLASFSGDLLKRVPSPGGRAPPDRRTRTGPVVRATAVSSPPFPLPSPLPSCSPPPPLPPSPVHPPSSPLLTASLLYPPVRSSPPLPPPPPPPPPPPVCPPPSPPSPAPALPPLPVEVRPVSIDELNARFANGHASSNLAEAGVLIHVFDRTEGDTTPPWVPCSSDEWCAKFSDRMSASLINSELKAMYSSQHAGLVLSPSASTILCSYFADGGTMNKFCQPPAPPGCVPGCADQFTSRPKWCVATDPDIFNCAWRPQDLDVMLRYHLSHAYSYNEVVLGTSQWTARLPNIIDAIYFMGDDEQAEMTARQTYSAFMATYPDASTLLVRLNIFDERPFQSVQF